MSRFKFFLYGLLVLVFFDFSAFGQTQIPKPNECINPPAGYSIGGDFAVSQFNCISPIQPNGLVQPANITGLNAVDGYNWDYKGGTVSIGAPTIKDNNYTKEGFYWILQVGTSPSGSKLIACKEIEVVMTAEPDLEVSSCGLAASVVIKNTPLNAKFGEFVIVWGDGTTPQTYQVTPGMLPFQIPTKTFGVKPANKPQVIGKPVRTVGTVKFAICSSPARLFDIGDDTAPRISELRGLKGGEEAKITMIKGNDDKEYAVEYKAKTASVWSPTTFKVKRIRGALKADVTANGLTKGIEYCFRLKSTDLTCGTPTISNEVCSIVLKADVQSPKVVKLDWNNPDNINIQKFNINYSDLDGTNPNSNQPNPATGTTFTFDQMNCAKKYKFSIEAQLYPFADRVLVYSPEAEVTPQAIGKLPPKTVGTVSVVNANTIKFSLYEPVSPEPKYTFYRSEGNSTDFKEVKQTKLDNFYEDKNVEPTLTQYCYRVKYFDECNNESELSPAFCSIFLTSNQANTLVWTPFVMDPNSVYPNSPEVEYFVEQFEAGGTTKPIDRTIKTTLNVKNTLDIALDDPAFGGKVTFQVRAVQRVNLMIGGVLTPFPFFVYSNVYTFITPAQLFVPNAFTPNGDGPNESEVFRANGRFIAEFNMLIYDRWGKPVFESRNLDDGWNGTEVDGNMPAPAGNYAYKIFGKDTAGQRFEKLGVITLLK